LAAELGGGISHMTVARLWAKHDLKPHRLEGYIASNDPDFETKAANIIDLYLNPSRERPKAGGLCFFGASGMLVGTDRGAIEHHFLQITIRTDGFEHTLPHTGFSPA
jgi:hypothetical protein